MMGLQLGSVLPCMKNHISTINEKKEEEKKEEKETNKQTYYTHRQHIVHTNNSFTSLEKLSLKLSGLEK